MRPGGGGGGKVARMVKSESLETTARIMGFGVLPEVEREWWLVGSGMERKKKLFHLHKG